MSQIDVTISCPHCRRQYTMRTDPERMARVKTRATCGRCHNSFDIASRIVNATQAPPPTSSGPSTRPALPRLRPPPPPLTSRPSAPPLTARPSTPTPTMSELNELAREFADAASRFTPVGVRPPPLPPPSTDAGASPAPSPKANAYADAVSTNPHLRAITSPEPSLVTPPAAASPSTTPSTTTPTTRATPIAPDTLATPDTPTTPNAPRLSSPTPTLTPLPDVSPELWTGIGDFDDDPKTNGIAAEPPGSPAVESSEAESWPRSWIDLADPGLENLTSPPSAAAAALELLL